MLNQRTSRLLVGVCCALAVVGCSRPDGAAVAPAARTQPPPVLPPPPAPPPSFLRDHYANLADCVYDWGYAQKCTPVAPGSPEQQAGAAFLGPIYARSYREETQAQLRREAVDGGYAQQVGSDASDRSMRKSEVRP
jgi:hypothetical protein